MTLGFRALKFSMNAACSTTGEKKEEISSWMMTVNVLFSLVFFIVMYKFVPLLLASRISATRAWAINLRDGVIRIGIFLAFLFLLSRMKDIRRVFEYHGAEHKVVFNFESGKPVTVENAQKFVTFHPRCGTSFLLVLMVIAMIVYALPADGQLLAQVRRAPRAVAVHHRLELRDDPLRRQAPGHADGTPDARPGCGCSGSPPSLPTIRRPPSRFTRCRAPWSSNRSRAASWSSPKHRSTVT